MKLYEITQDFAELENLFDDAEVDEQTLLDTLEGIEGEYNDVMEYECKMIKNYEALAKAKKEEADRLSNQVRTINNRIKWLKKYMIKSLIATGKEEAGGDILTCKLTNAGGKQKLELDEEKVPITYKKIEYKIDNEAIRKALDEGQKLDFAHYGEKSKVLRIK